MSKGGARIGAGRKARTTSKAKSIWCGQISESDRVFILRWLSPEKRYKVLMAAANNCARADGDTWRWADTPCPKCGHVHWAFGSEVKHCIVCQYACDYYGEASFVTPALPRR